jgi:hypothetical protein
MPDAMSPPRRGGPGSARRTLLLIATLAFAPVIASYAVYYFFPREPSVNYGTLLPTAPAALLEGTRADGSRFRLDELRGRWVLLAVGRGACDAGCERTLYAMRQARTMQGKEQDRVVRVWAAVGDAGPAAGIPAEQPGLIVVRASETAAAALPGGIGHVYVIDPLGNLVLRYPDSPDIRGVARDLARLLKASRIG